MRNHKVIHPILPRSEYDNMINVRKAKGVTIYDENKSYLDGISGLWNGILGHSNEEINQAILQQMNEVSYVNPWTSSTNIVYELADKLISFTDDNFDKVMFTCTGSEAVELAIKLVRRHQSAKGHYEKKYIGVFETSYHGTHYGSMTATGVDREFYKPYGPMLQGFAYLPIPFEEKGTLDEAIQSLEKFFEAYGDKIGGFIMEPILGVSGVVKLPDTYLRRMKELSKQYDVLLVFDEISTGFYRTGPKFAYEETPIIPDILCLSKGINNGVLPLGAVLIGESVTKMIKDHDFINHFSTQNANPLCCAAALKTLELLGRDDYCKIIETKGDFFYRQLLLLKEELPFVKSIRAHGLMIGVEVDIDNDFNKVLQFSNLLKERGLLVYPYANKYSSGVMLMPAYVMEYENLSKVSSILRNSIIEYVNNRYVGSL
ncbi:MULTISPECIES: aminotransferase family protein [Sutcliffiella]|uniref:aminotransferase family protein n=1 Tax=Sutcliffiella TaxID=2837511 RepID=UPI0012FE3782|nr:MULTISPECIES: aspartate aminotransferase family protein [Sutcliffiella]WBL14691.1 aspartate aminotransferase family protein [Sutcliffiella sp. NC1]